jgi:hypothetical protein
MREKQKNANRRRKMKTESKEFKSWAKEVTPYIQTRIMNGESPQDAVRNGMADYTAMLDEMWKQETKRSREATSILSEIIYQEINE